MKTVHLIRNEFELRVFGESYPRIDKCLNVLTQNQIWSTPNDVLVPVGCLVKHLLGNMQQWLYSGVLKEPFIRDRDFEFIAQEELNKKDLLDQMKEAKKRIIHALDQLTETHLTKNYKIQGFETTGFSAIIHVIEHFSYHTGQITTLTKLFTSQETDYYEERDLNG